MIENTTFLVSPKINSIFVSNGEKLYAVKHSVDNVDSVLVCVPINRRECVTVDAKALLDGLVELLCDDVNELVPIVDYEFCQKRLYDEVKYANKLKDKNARQKAELRRLNKQIKQLCNCRHIDER